MPSKKQIALNIVFYSLYFISIHYIVYDNFYP
nr:MAG TPA: hypothetical protein [Caudoviricetes sp.]